ncbi:MAG: flagellin [Pseudomonadota bacterium]
MSFSVNTNGTAFLALQNLTSTNQALTTTQNRISTGLKVASAKDNSAIFAIAQGLRSDVGGLNAIKQSLDRASSTIDVGVAAAETISNLLIDAKEKAVAAADVGLDADSRAALKSEYDSILAQVDAVAGQASFNGTNLVNAVDADAVQALTGDDDFANQNITVAGVDLTTTALTAATFTDAATAATAVAALDADIDTVSTALSSFGSASRQIELQRNFADTLSDSIETGVGNLVDADLARESAKLQSLQVKQQLGLQALSIANQAPSSVLSLFR